MNEMDEIDMRDPHGVWSKPALLEEIRTEIGTGSPKGVLLSACLDRISELEQQVSDLRMQITKISTERNTLASAIKLVERFQIWEEDEGHPV